MKELLEKWEEFGKVYAKTLFLYSFEGFMAWYKEQYKEQEANKPWVPKEYDIYWYVSTSFDLKTISSSWQDGETDYKRLASKNVFQTNALAEAALERVKAALKNL